MEVHEGRICGPILSAQYTLSRDILKLTAQMMPLGSEDEFTARLEIEKDGRWREFSTTEIIRSGFIAPFRIENWDSTQDIPYRVLYDLKLEKGKIRTYSWSGTIKRDPLEKEKIILAAFTGNHNVRPGGVDHGSFVWTPAGCWFPHNELMNHLFKHQPDVLFFSGDQVYESSSPTHV